MHRGAVLVADDRCILHRDGADLVARAPAALAGLMEVRGLGILEMPHAPQAHIELVIEMAAHRGGVDRLPEPRSHTELDVSLPCWRLHPFDVSSEIKVDLALSIARGKVSQKW
jgi:serine kinase of HPr protein (carbohydrate metabolism regulator)